MGSSGQVRAPARVGEAKAETEGIGPRGAEAGRSHSVLLPSLPAPCPRPCKVLTSQSPGPPGGSRGRGRHTPIGDSRGEHPAHNCGFQAWGARSGRAALGRLPRVQLSGTLSEWHFQWLNRSPRDRLDTLGLFGVRQRAEGGQFSNTKEEILRRKVLSSGQKTAYSFGTCLKKSKQEK